LQRILFGKTGQSPDIPLRQRLWYAPRLLAYRVLPLRALAGMAILRSRLEMATQADLRKRFEALLAPLAPQGSVPSLRRQVVLSRTIRRLGTHTYAPVSRRSREWLMRTFQPEGLEHLEEIKRSGQGAIILGSHAGLNGWVAPILIQLGFPMWLMQRPHMSPHRLMNLEQDGWSDRVIPSPLEGEEGAHLKRLHELLRQKEWIQHGADAIARDEGVLGTFLGRPVRGRTALWVLGRLAGVPLVPALVLADEHLVPRLVVGPPIRVSSTGPSKDAMQAAFQAYLDFMTSQLARAPWNLSLVDWERFSTSVGGAADPLVARRPETIRSESVKGAEPAPAAPDLSIIIVSYHCREALASCLASLAACTPRVSTEVLVIDNASRDGTAEMVRERFGTVRLIANAENRGLAAAANQGLAVAVGRHILFLNPDTIVHDGTLEGMVRLLDGDPTIGACGPRLEDLEGSLQPSARRLPTVTACLYQYTPLRLLRVFRGAYERYKMVDFDFGHAADVESLMGAALCVPRRVMDEVGGLDERFFVYFEEVDLCRRILERGHRIRFDPSFSVTHLGGVSANSAASNLLFCRSLFRYLGKYHRRAATVAVVGGLWLGMMIREGGQLLFNPLAAGVRMLTGRRERARRRMRRAAVAARFLFRDAWRVL
jgi:GT2 family glycosyltransferase